MKANGRYLVKLKNQLGIVDHIVEVKVMEVSPSGHFFKLKGLHEDSHWRHKDNLIVVEKLPDVQDGSSN